MKALKLPKIKNSISSFILGEEARVIDSSMSKIALFSSFFAINMISNIDEVNAQGHSNHSNHSNHIALNGKNLNCINDGTVIHGKDALGNDGNSSLQVAIEANPKNNRDIFPGTIVEVISKTLKSVHANHYNHANESGGFLDTILNIFSGGLHSVINGDSYLPDNFGLFAGDEGETEDYFGNVCIFD